MVNKLAPESFDFPEGAAPGTPDTGYVRIYSKTDGNMYQKDDTGTETQLGSSGLISSFNLDADSGTPETVNDAETLTVAGGTGIDTSVAATNTVTVAIDSTVATLTGAQTLTNKTIDADNNTVSNIGAAEVKADLVTGQTADATPTGSTDYVLTHKSGSGLRKVLMDDLPGGGLYTSLAILSDQKTTGTAGGSSSAGTWNNRDLNTEDYDPDGVVSISSNQFTPVSGTYHILAEAASGDASTNNKHRLRLYNVTGTASVQEGLNAQSASGARSPARLDCVFTANGTDAYRIDHYTEVAQVTNGLGIQISDGSAEIYLVIVLRKL